MPLWAQFTDARDAALKVCPPTLRLEADNAPFTVRELLMVVAPLRVVAPLTLSVVRLLVPVAVRLLRVDVPLTLRSPVMVVFLRLVSPVTVRLLFTVVAPLRVVVPATVTVVSKVAAPLALKVPSTMVFFSEVVPLLTVRPLAMVSAPLLTLMPVARLRVPSALVNTISSPVPLRLAMVTSLPALPMTI